jgi:hypothetical protein
VNVFHRGAESGHRVDSHVLRAREPGVCEELGLRAGCTDPVEPVATEVANDDRAVRQHCQAHGRPARAGEPGGHRDELAGPSVEPNDGAGGGAGDVEVAPGPKARSEGNRRLSAANTPLDRPVAGSNLMMLRPAELTT